MRTNGSQSPATNTSRLRTNHRPSHSDAPQRRRAAGLLGKDRCRSGRRAKKRQDEVWRTLSGSSLSRSRAAQDTAHLDDAQRIRIPFGHQLAISV